MRWNGFRGRSTRSSSRNDLCSWFGTGSEQFTRRRDDWRCRIKTLANWVFRVRRGQLATLGESRRPMTELEVEAFRLKRELAEARIERDTLKQPTAYVAKAQLPGTHACRRCALSIPCPCTVGSCRCFEATGGPAGPRRAPLRTHGWKWRSRRCRCAPGICMDRNACERNCGTTGFHPGLEATREQARQEISEY